jgi:hypothetical protein
MRSFAACCAGTAKQSIIAFVEKVTKPGWPDFVPVPERIATFDNDGTLWSEHRLNRSPFRLRAPRFSSWVSSVPRRRSSRSSI